MKKKQILTVGILLIGMMLTACANKETMSGAASSQTGSARGSGQTSADASSGTTDSAGADTQGTVDQGGADNQQAAEGTDASAGSASAEDAKIDPDATYDAQNQAGGDVNATIWDGAYIADTGETLTVTKTDEYSLSFAFADCGISGTAYCEGNEASYNGDDSNIIHFVLSGGSITVTLTNEEGYSTEGSILPGTYVLQ